MVAWSSADSPTWFPTLVKRALATGELETVLERFTPPSKPATAVLNPHGGGEEILGRLPGAGPALRCYGFPVGAGVTTKGGP